VKRKADIPFLVEGKRRCVYSFKEGKESELLSECLQEGSYNNRGKLSIWCQDIYRGGKGNSILGGETGEAQNEVNNHLGSPRVGEGKNLREESFPLQRFERKEYCQNLRERLKREREDPLCVIKP